MANLEIARPEKTFRLLDDLLNFGLANVFCDDSLGLCGWLEQIFVNVHGNHFSSLLFIGQTEFNRFIDTIHNSRIELGRLVTGVYHHELIGFSTFSEQKVIESRPFR